MKTKRVIITADYLIELFGHLDTPVLLVALAPFCLPGKDAPGAFIQIIEDLGKELDQPGKTGAISAVEDLARGYSKMTIFERERIRRDLPKKLAKLLMSRGVK